MGSGIGNRGEEGGDGELGSSLYVEKTSALRVGVAIRAVLLYSGGMELDPKSKIEKVVGDDPTVPVLLTPWLRRVTDTSGVLLCSGGKNAVAVPVLLTPDDVEGPVPVEALKELRKVKGGVLRCEAQYCILPSGAAWPRARHSSFPPIEQLLVESGPEVVEVSLSTKSLYALAQAQGCDVVKLKLEIEDGNFVGKVVGVEPHPSEPHAVGSRAALLPYVVRRV